VVTCLYTTEREGILERTRRVRGFPEKLAIGAIFLALAFSAHTAYAGPFEEGVSFFDGGHYRWWYVAESYRMLGDTAASAHVYRQILQTAPASPFAVSARQALETLGEPGASTFQVPIQRRGGSALVPARVNGESVGMFILDTGASYTSVSTTVANRLGISTSGGAVVRLATASGVIQAPLAVLDEIDVGGAVARHVPVVVHDLPGMPSHVAGLLGMTFLERFRVNLDMGSSLLILESGN
jgi:clan AA aspartic protease (TIGR02281 family)